MTLQTAAWFWNEKRADAFGFVDAEPATAGQCLAMREFYPIGGRVLIYGVEAEVISHPFPSKYVASVKVRVPGDPTTITEVAVNPLALRGSE